MTPLLPPALYACVAEKYLYTCYVQLLLILLINCSIEKD